MSTNPDISNWNVSNVTNMSNMFKGITNFTQDITNWDVSNVVNMKGMFSNTTNFNQDISKWDVSNVVNMENMFKDSTSFDQDISNWNVTNTVNMENMFQNTSRFIGTNKIKDGFNLYIKKNNSINEKIYFRILIPPLYCKCPVYNYKNKQFNGNTNNSTLTNNMRYSQIVRYRGPRFGRITYINKSLNINEFGNWSGSPNGFGQPLKNSF